MMRTVYLVRHGATAMNAETAGPARERGWCDVPLDAAGRAEARRVGKELVDLKVNVLVSSDLPRARQSARIIGDVIGVEPEFASQLRTWNTGDWHGDLKSEVEPRIARLVRSAPDRAPPGGESFNAFRRRIFAILADLLVKHDGRLAVVIHSRIERLLEAWKAAGSKRTHAIDADVFLRQGERPGHVEPWRVDPLALKLSHDEADFGEGKTKGDLCGICRAYAGPDRCSKVWAPIDADDWCAVGVARSDGHWFSGIDRLPH
jgi:broad specificity phosphatase PhoE